MTSKTVIYRYLKSRGIKVNEAYEMATELSSLIEINAQSSD